MIHIIPPGTNIDFVGKRKFWMLFSAFLMVGSIVLVLTRGLNFGIDFTGGAEVLVKVPATWDIGQVREAMQDADIKDARVVSFGAPEQSEYLVKVAGGDESTLNLVAGRVESALKAKLKSEEFQILRTEVVGPAAGSSLRMAGFLSMLYALLAMLIYIAVRFDMRYGPGAIISLAHDVLITLGIWSLLQVQFDLQILAALLALIGYSINDTIVIFDRVREVSHDHPDLTIEKKVNRAINETLGRSILTSGTTFLSALALYIFGGETLAGFSLTFLIGIIAGTYSSIYIAGPLVIYMTQYYDRKPKKQARKRTPGFRPEPKANA